MVNLVKIEKNRYTFFRDGKKVISVDSDSPLDEKLVEHYRKHPDKLVAEMMQENPDEFA